MGTEFFTGRAPEEVPGDGQGEVRETPPAPVKGSSDTVSWLTSVPASDQNFKSALQRATDEELARAQALVKAMPEKGNKLRLQALSNEIWKRAAAVQAHSPVDPAASNERLAGMVAAAKARAVQPKVAEVTGIAAPGSPEGTFLPVLTKKAQRAMRDAVDGDRYTDAFRLADSFDREQREAVEALTRMERILKVAVSARLIPETMCQTKGGMIDDLKVAMRRLGSFDEVLDAACAERE